MVVLVCFCGLLTLRHRLQRFAEDRLGYLCEFDWKPEATAGGQWIWVEEEPKVYKTKGKGKGKGVKGGKAKGKGKRSLGPERGFREDNG